MDSSSQDKRRVIPSSSSQSHLGFAAHHKDVIEEESSRKELFQFILVDVNKPEICLTILNYFPKPKSGSVRMFRGSGVKSDVLAGWLVTLAYLEQKYVFISVLALPHAC